MKKKTTINSSIPVQTKTGKKGLIIKIVIITLLLVANGCLVFYIFNRSEKKDDTKPIDVVSEQIPTQELTGETWVDGDKRYIFAERGFTYYDKYNSNYYEGTYKVKKGNDALEEMGYTEEDLKTQFGEGINKENVLSIELYPTKRIVDKVDKSKVIKENTEWWLLLIIKDEQNALGYNKTLDERYELKKIEQ